MTDDRLVKIGLKNATGLHEFVYTVPHTNALIANLIAYLQKIPSAPALEGIVQMATPPIYVDGMGIEPDPNSEKHALLTLKAGEAILVFSIPIGDLVEQLEFLKEKTIPDPSAPRPN